MRKNKRDRMINCEYCKKALSNKKSYYDGKHYFCNKNEAKKFMKEGVKSGT